MKDILFLIGGMDLEMQTIKEILNKQNITYKDKYLPWGARLSAYSDILESDTEYKTIYGIELEQDIIPPRNYVDINHHDEKSNLGSALEQVASILSIELTRDQQLIAANDKGYIPAMERLNATKDEIDNIRYRDRQAQGVTELDEHKGEESITMSKQVFGDLIVVKSSTPKFSTITDRLYPYKKLLVYTDTEWTFYGSENDIKFFKSNKYFENRKLYSGKNYLGCGKDNAVNDQIDKDIKFFINDYHINEEHNDIRSQHIFYFPFMWEWRDNTQGTLNEQIGFNKVGENTSESWRRVTTETPKRQSDAEAVYDEKCYFFDSVAEVFYDKNNNTKVKHFERIEPSEKECYYCISIKDTTYKLHLQAINLNLYSTGVGILMFFLENRDMATTTDDILNINQFGRRIFPPFFQDIETRSQIAKSVEIIGLELSGLKEDFVGYKDKVDEPGKIACFIEKLIDDCQAGLDIKPACDDRMFVSSLYLDNEMSELANRSDSLWYKYVFIDSPGDPTCQDYGMLKQLIEKSTYSRWTNYGTLFGISRYSFTAIAAQNWFSQNVLARQMRTLYARMIESVLVQRTSILKFSISAASIKLGSDKTKQTSNVHPIRSLYKEYIYFMNNYFFKDITYQDQGIELYEMLYKHMDIEKSAKELKEEITDLHNYHSMLVDDKRNSAAFKLNSLAGAAVPITILLAIYGMNTNIAMSSPTVGNNDELFHWICQYVVPLCGNQQWTCQIFLSIIIAGLVTFWTLKWIKKDEK